jgi:AcrR family transcriptional regulator
MAPEPALSPAARRIVETAEALFHERGITAVGVDLVAERSGVTKRTLYNRFGSKDRLVAACLTARATRWRTDVLDAVAAATDPVDALLAPFEALREWTAASTRGCGFVNALAELPDPEHPGHGVAVGQKAWLLDLLTDLAAAAGSPDPGALATRLLIVHEGALATRPTGLDTLDAAVGLARSLVRQDRPPAATR